MFRRTFLAASATALAIVFAHAAQAQDKVVHVYNWSDYIDQSLLDDFTKETGIKVVYDVFDSNEVLETKLLAGGSGYDVVVPTASFLARQIQAGVFQKLDRSKLPNWDNQWDAIMQRTAVYDPGNEYSINYMWGTDGIGYNIDKVKAALGVEEIDSWDVVYKPENMEKLKECGVYFLDQPVDMIASALKYLGVDPNSNSSDDIAKAQELLLSVRPYIRKFHSSEYINALANGDICVAVGSSGDMFQARDRAEEAKAGVKIGYSIPKEGAQMWFDQMAIPADAKNVDAAHAFINYMLKPEVAAKASDATFYANGNKAAQPMMNKEIVDDPSIYPSEATMNNLYTVVAKDPKTQRVVTRAWTRVTTGQ